VEKCESPMSSKLLFLFGLPMFGKPWRNELDLFEIEKLYIS